MPHAAVSTGNAAVSTPAALLVLLSQDLELWITKEQLDDGFNLAVSRAALIKTLRRHPLPSMWAPAFVSCPVCHPKADALTCLCFLKPMPPAGARGAAGAGGARGHQDEPRRHARSRAARPALNRLSVLPRRTSGVSLSRQCCRFVLAPVCVKPPRSLAQLSLVPISAFILCIRAPAATPRALRSRRSTARKHSLVHLCWVAVHVKIIQVVRSGRQSRGSQAGCRDDLARGFSWEEGMRLDGKHQATQGGHGRDQSTT